jgi:hypothetical protein
MKGDYTQLSIYYKGYWIFVEPSKVISESGGRKFYRVDYKFKLVKEGEKYPEKGITREAGNYIAKSPNGVIDFLTERDYRAIFPYPNRKPPETPKTSSELKDPNYLTKVLQESPTSSYNRPIPKNL